MKSNIKALWIEALRSGNYAQGRNALQDGNGQFCCLGVLCDLAVRAEEDIKVRYVGDAVAYDGRTDFLPWSVREWSGMDTNDGVILDTTGDVVTTLANANDAGMSFTEIADLIEKYF